MTSELDKNSCLNNGINLLSNLPNKLNDDYSSTRNSNNIFPEEDLSSDSKNNSNNINNNNNNSLTPKNIHIQINENYIANIANNPNLSPGEIKKIKQLENIINQKSINLNELRKITWNGLPFGKF